MALNVLRSISNPCSGNIVMNLISFVFFFEYELSNDKIEKCKIVYKYIAFCKYIMYSKIDKVRVSK